MADRWETKLAKRTTSVAKDNNNENLRRTLREIVRGEIGSVFIMREVPLLSEQQPLLEKYVYLYKYQIIQKFYSYFRQQTKKSRLFDTLLPAIVVTAEVIPPGVFSFVGKYGNRAF